MRVPCFLCAYVFVNQPLSDLECLNLYLRNLVCIYWPTLWSSGQSSWPQIQRSGFDSRLYQIFWEVVGLERGPLSLVSTIKELLGRKRSGSGLENREYGRRVSSRWPRGILYPQNLAITSLTWGGSSVGIVRSRTQATEFSSGGYLLQEIIKRTLDSDNAW
jgi:hypothetical protein